MGAYVCLDAFAPSRSRMSCPLSSPRGGEPKRRSGAFFGSGAAGLSCGEGESRAATEPRPALLARVIRARGKGTEG